MGDDSVGDVAITSEQAAARIRPAVIVWAFAGLFGIPFAVYFDLLGGWRWPPYNPVYDQMIVSIYVGVGICATIAIRHPLRHTSFLWFIVVSSLLHGLVMLYHASQNPMHIRHLAGDVWILLGAAVLGWPLWQARRIHDHG